eukprot:1579343-Rhodomonas_salina.4
MCGKKHNPFSRKLELSLKHPASSTIPSSTTSQLRAGSRHSLLSGSETTRRGKGSERTGQTRGKT